MTTLIQITEDEFFDTYPLEPNPFDPHAGWVVDDAGCLFGTSGDELAYVQQRPRSHVWTLLEGDTGKLSLWSGLRVVNRLGYLVSTKPTPPTTEIIVRISTNNERS